MKKTMKTLLALMAGVMTFSACSNEDVQINETPNVTPEVKSTRTFTAYTEGDGASRATIDGFSIKWQDDDAILVLAGDSKERYLLSDGANTTSGTFTGNSVSGSEIYALAPFLTQEWITSIYWPEVSKLPVSLDGTTIKGVTLTNTQKVVGDQVVDPRAMVMVGKADEVDNLNFKNVCSYIKVTAVAPCEKIWVHALSDAATLAGKFDVDMSSGVPTVTSISNEDKHSEVTLTSKDGMLAPGTYYIGVLPGTASSGLEIRFYADNTTYREHKTTNSFTFERNKVYNGGVSQAPTGTAKRTGDIDVKWVQLWLDGPKFAEYNVGAANNKAEDYGGYYFWGGHIDMDPKDAYSYSGTVLTGNEDTATNLWGSNWRMPTLEELQALIDNCDVEWTTVNGVNGRKFTGKGNYASNSLFLPAAGYYGDEFHDELEMQGVIGSYWSSTPGDYSYDARILFFQSDCTTVNYDDRSNANSVRAVLAE